MTLRYAKFVKELRLAKIWTVQDVVDRINDKYAPEIPVTVSQYYTWEEGKTEPRTGFTKAVEGVFEITLGPDYYGFREAKR
jgi:transcriptional regulator with XRE-family HTH domain